MIKNATVNRSKRSFQPTPQFLAAGGFAPENNESLRRSRKSREQRSGIIEVNVLYHSLLGLASGESDFADKHSLNTVSGLQGALDRTKWRLYVQADNFRLVKNN